MEWVAFMPLRCLLCVFWSLFLVGCASSVAHTTSWSDIGDEFEEELENTSYAYSGFCLNLKMIENHKRSGSHSDAMGILAFYDMPLSITLDTALLPIDIGYDLYRYADHGSYPNSLCSK